MAQMDKKNIQQTFDFVFDAPTYSEFLPNKDMNYYNPLETKINEKNELDQWFLVYHEDHYQNKSQKSRGKKSSKDQLENKMFPIVRSKGDQLPKIKKRKQISTDEYQQKIEAVQQQQQPKKQQSKQIKRQSNNYTEKNNKESVNAQFKFRRNSKDDTLNISNQMKSIPERKSRISSQSRSSSQVKRVTRSKSNSQDVKSFQEIPAAIKSNKQVKAEQNLSKQLNKNGQKMIVEYEQKSNQNTQETKTKGSIDSRLEVINENKSDADTIQAAFLQQTKKSISQAKKDKEKSSTIMEECPSSKAESKYSLKQQKEEEEDKVELTQNNNQNSNLCCNLDNNQINDSLFQNKSTVQMGQETIPSQKSPQIQNKMLEEVNHAVNQYDRRDSGKIKIFNQIDNQINNQILITPNKYAAAQDESKLKQKSSTPVLSSHSREDSSIIQLKIYPKNDENLQVSQRTRVNKHKLEIQDDNNFPSQYRRHQSLNVSKPRKSIALDNSALAVSNKRKSEIVSVKRSKSIDEQKQDQQMKDFEKEWEKKNGVKLYMLNYQKRKEIKQLFFHSEKLKLNFI